MLKESLKRKARNARITLTKRINGKRVYKTEAELKRELNRKNPKNVKRLFHS